MFRYMTVTADEKVLQSILNGYAENGWRAVSVYMKEPHRDIVGIVLERPDGQR